MKKIFTMMSLIFLFPVISSAALPPHFERARVMGFVLSQSAELFPIDPITKIEFKEGNDYWVQTQSGCGALVRAVFERPNTPVLGPVPLKGIQVLETL